MLNVCYTEERGFSASGAARSAGSRVIGGILVLLAVSSVASASPLPVLLVAEELTRKNHPEGEQSYKCPGRGDSKHSGIPPTIWFRQYCTKLLRLVCANVKNMLRGGKENSTPLPLRRRGVRYSVAPASLPDTCYQYGLLLAEENPGKNDPEGEESCESSGGGDGYHWLASSEIVVPIVSGQVVTSRLRRCKIFVTCKFLSRPHSAVWHRTCLIAAEVAPCRERHTGTGRQERSVNNHRKYRPGAVDLLAVALGELPRQNDPQGEQSEKRARSSQCQHSSYLRKRATKLYEPIFAASCYASFSPS